MDKEVSMTNVPTKLLQHTIDYIGTCPSKDVAELWVNWKIFFSPKNAPAAIENEAE